MKIHEIAKKYKCSDNTIYNRLEQIGINIIVSIDLPIKQIILDYTNGLSTNIIAKKYNCSNVTIIKRLRQNNIKIRSNSEAQSVHLLYLPIRQIILDYENGLSANIIAEKYNCSSTTIIKKLKESNIDIRTYKERHNIISQRKCVNCGHDFMGRSTAIYCQDCNESGYCYKYNKDCKEHNREKYNHKCFFCDKSEEDNGRKLDTHHADYNKNQGCDDTPDWKLVPLCRSCHSMTGGGEEKRKIWEARILYLHNEYWNSILIG